MTILDPQSQLLLAKEQESSGRQAEAEATLRAILAAFPLHAESLHLLATLLQESKRTDEALAMVQKAAGAAPGDAAIQNTLAAFLANRGDFEAAGQIWRRLHELNPGVADYCHNLGRLAQHHGRVDEAIEWYYKALKIKPAALTTCENLSEVLRAKHDYVAAGQVLAEALKHFPENTALHLRFSYALMMTGQLADGWNEFEWRWKSPEMTKSRHYEKPDWFGEDLHGRSILLYCEQGVGDTLLFVRYAEIVAALGAKVIVECQPEIKSLLIHMPSISAVRAKGEALPEYNFQIPLMSVPRVVGISVDSIPAKVPYLSPDARKVKTWAQRLDKDPQLAGAKRVGLVWAGSTINPNDKRRSIPLTALASLTTVPGIQFYSLQKGKAVEELNTAKLPIIDHTRHLTNFEETAAFIANLDLVISVCTAPAHLAGAMNRPVWVPLGELAYWLWMSERQDSPWYPSMRLFRQTVANDWTAPLQAVETELRAWAVG